MQSVPIGWFTRSNFGSRFSAMLKFAGWDGIVIEGQADDPVWLDIRNGSVKIRNCCPLMFNRYGRQAHIEQLLKMISFRNDGLGNSHPFEDDLAEGFVRAAEKWGGLDGDEGDVKTGRLKFPKWGLPQHKEPRSQLDWAYGSILGDRDINEHGFDELRSHPTASKIYGFEMFQIIHI